MNYKGSIVIKKTELLDWIEDADDMFKTFTLEDFKHSAFGQGLALTNILYDNYIKFKHNEDVQSLWRNPLAGCPTSGEILSMIVGAEQR